MTNLTQINDHIFIDQARLLGKGSTGNVYFGSSSRDQSRKFAVKAIDLSEVTNEVTQYLLSCEIVALSELAKLNIQTVVRLEDVAFSEGFCYLVMELLEGGSLADYIKENPNGLSQHEAEQLFKQMFQGYKAIRNQGIVHRDIKPDNIIFRYKFDQNRQDNVSKRLCFIDFGYCTKQSVPNRPKVYYNVGSPKYMSPQAYKKNQYSQKSDIWALGIILYEMLHGKTIDKDMDMEDYLKFMEQNDIPVTRNVNQFLRNLLKRMLTFDDKMRISCEEISQILSRNYQAHQNRNFHNIPSLSNLAQTPLLNIPGEQFDKRNSPFYRSEIISHRSDRSDNTFNSIIHPNASFDPRRQQRNHSHENMLQEYNRSPKKMIHIEQFSHKVNGMILNVPHEKRFFSQNMNYAEQRNSTEVFNGPMGPIRRQLQKIEEQNDYHSFNKQIFTKNSMIYNNTRIQPQAKRGFLRTMDQRSSFQQLIPMTQNNPRISNPNIRLMNNPTFQLNPNTPNKPSDLVRSQIFHVPHERSFDNGNQHFTSQITQDVPPPPNIKVITSDKAIYNRGLDSPAGTQLMNKSLNKSYSTQHVDRRDQNPPNLVNSRFAPFVNPDQGQSNSKAQQAIPTNNLRPIDLLIQNKQTAQNRAFLRSTMPNVYKSTIEQFSHHRQSQVNQQEVRSNLENSVDVRNQPNLSLIDQAHQSNFKNHAQYFDQSVFTPQKEIYAQNQVSISNFNPDSSFSAGRNGRNKAEKSHSFRFTPFQQNIPQVQQREGIRLNFVNQALGSANQYNQLNQQQPNSLQFNPMSAKGNQINAHQQFQVPINQPPVHGNQPNHQQIPHNQVFTQQGTQQTPVFFTQQQNPRILLNNQPHQINHQPIMQPPNPTQTRPFIPTQITQFQQPRQAIFMQRQPFSHQQQHIPQNQRPSVVNNFIVNSNINTQQINRMVRPTYPFGNSSNGQQQQQVTVMQF